MVVSLYTIESSRKMVDKRLTLGGILPSIDSFQPITRYCTHGLHSRCPEKKKQGL